MPKSLKYNYRLKLPLPDFICGVSISHPVVPIVVSGNTDRPSPAIFWQLVDCGGLSEPPFSAYELLQNGASHCFEFYFYITFIRSIAITTSLL